MSHVPWESKTGWQTSLLCVFGLHPCGHILSCLCVPYLFLFSRFPFNAGIAGCQYLSISWTKKGSLKGEVAGILWV
jgi:hypothetical protein